MHTLKITRLIMSDLQHLVDIYEREEWKHGHDTTDSEADAREKINAEIESLTKIGMNEISEACAEFIDGEFDAFDGCDWWTVAHDRFHMRLKLSRGQLEPFVPGWYTTFGGERKCKPDATIDGIKYQHKR